MGKLKIKDKAIQFHVSDYRGQAIDLIEFKDQKVLISFFRGASCPFCNMRVQELIKRYPDFKEQKINIITFFASSKEDIANYAGKQNTPFPVIPDPDLFYYRQ